MEEEIDLLGILKNIINNKGIIVKITLFLLFFGIFFAFTSDNKYSSNTIIVLQTSDNKPKLTGNISGLASLAGINLGDFSGESLSPQIYPQIIKSADFQRELMLTKFKFENIVDSITLYDFYTNKNYLKFNLRDFLYSYSIGLPFQLVKLVKGNETETLNDSVNIRRMTNKQKKVVNILNDIIILTFFDKEGYISIKAETTDPNFSCQLVQEVTKLLQKYIINFKIQKAELNLDYTEQRYIEAKNKFEAIQTELASLKDANRNVNSELARIKLERLNSEFSLRFNVYSDLAIQLEKARIKVTENTPVLSIIDVPMIPNVKSGPNRILILLIFLFIGFCLSVSYILIKPYFGYLKREYKKIK